jgi:thioredoxin reductase (NADPH)
VLEKLSPGGQMTETQNIENYPGFSDGIDGFTLGFNMQSGAEKFGAESAMAEGISANLSENPKIITTDNGEVLAKTVIIATGAHHKHLGIKNEEELIGRGVGYCAACDGMLYKDKTVAVVGGGNSAVQDALLLSRICKKVYLIHRRDTLRATKIYHEPLMKTENVEFLWNSAVDEFLFEKKLYALNVKNLKDGSIKTVELDGVFISIGRAPVSELFKNEITLDEQGYIVADESTKTNIPGVFAAGDIRTKALRQVVTAAADGAVAAHFAEEYISQL